MVVSCESYGFVPVLSGDIIEIGRATGTGIGVMTDMKRKRERKKERETSVKGTI